LFLSAGGEWECKLFMNSQSMSWLHFEKEGQPVLFRAYTEKLIVFPCQKL
jgi:hypothetical protein